MIPYRNAVASSSGIGIHAGRNPFGVKIIVGMLPSRVADSRQPFAMLRNPVGILKKESVMCNIPTPSSHFIDDVRYPRTRAPNS